MRYFLFVLIAGLIIGSWYRITHYRTAYGSLDGIVYLEQPGNKVIPLKGLTVFLILGKMEDEFHFIEKQYQSEIGPREASVNNLQNGYEKTQGLVDQTATQILRNNSRTEAQRLKSVMDKLRAKRDSLYSEYSSVKSEYSQIQYAFNARLTELINKYSSMQAETDNKGRYRFPKIKQRKYYIYAERRSFIESYIWFVPIEITEDGHRVNLSRTNLAHIFK